MNTIIILHRRLLELNNIYLWLGLTKKTEEEYWNCFSKKMKPHSSALMLDWLDEDFIGYYYNKNTNDLETAIENTLESGLYDIMYKVCMDKNIKQANAMFYYTGDDIEKNG
jgi:hypothetical protein